MKSSENGIDSLMPQLGKQTQTRFTLAIVALKSAPLSPLYQISFRKMHSFDVWRPAV